MLIIIFDVIDKNQIENSQSYYKQNQLLIILISPFFRSH